MTGTVTTAARRVTACLLVTTQRLSPTPPCTSIPWGLGSSSTQTPAQTLSTALTWTTGTREEPGRVTVTQTHPQSVAHAEIDRSAFTLFVESYAMQQNTHVCPHQVHQGDERLETFIL